MKVLLVNLPSSGTFEGFVGGTHFPLGIGYIASTLQTAGHFVKVIDLNLDYCLNKVTVKNIPHIIKKEDYDVLGLGGVFLNFEYLKKCAEASKIYHADKAVIAGGTMISSIPQIVLEHTKVDILVIGEGELTIVELLKQLQGGGDINGVEGIAYKKDGEIIRTRARRPIQNLDDIPFPARDLFPYKRVFRKYFTFGIPGRYCGRIITSRGCPFSCTFCSSLFGKKPRVRNADNIIAEIEHLKSRYNVQYIRFVDELFFGGRRDLIANFCNRIIKKRIKFTWYCMPNQNTIDAGIIALMKKAGCIGMGFGTESISETILREFKKNNSLERLKENLQACHEHKIDLIISLLGGSFSETKETLNETKDFIKSINHMKFVMPAAISCINIIPGTELYEQAKTKGYIKDEVEYIINLYKYTRWDFSINLTSMPKEKFQNLLKNVNSEMEDDYYKKHPFIRLIRNAGLDHINWRYVFRDFHPRQIAPFIYVLLWSIFSKRKNVFYKWVQLLIYNDYIRTTYV